MFVPDIGAGNVGFGAAFRNMILDTMETAGLNFDGLTRLPHRCGEDRFTEARVLYMLCNAKRNTTTQHGR